MIAAQIIDVLRAKHSKDVFAEEMSDSTNRFRIDAWAMPKSWTRWRTIGYEIKVSRSDFLNDDKWPNYLPFCHEFYFVCPWGMIAVDEIPESAGLLYVTKTGSGTRVKKKAPVRIIPFPGDLLIRIAMRATAFSNDWDQSPTDSRAARIQDMMRAVQNRKDGWALDHLVKAKIRNRMREAEREAGAAKAQAATLEDTARIIEELGIPNTRWNRQINIKRAIDIAMGKASPELISRLEKIAVDIENVLPELRGESE